MNYPVTPLPPSLFRERILRVALLSGVYTRRIFLVVDSTAIYLFFFRRSLAFGIYGRNAMCAGKKVGRTPIKFDCIGCRRFIKAAVYILVTRVLLFSRDDFIYSLV